MVHSEGDRSTLVHHLSNIPILENRLHAKFGVSKPVIIIDNCMVKKWFTFANLQSVSLKRNCQCKQYCISYWNLYLNDQFWHTCTLKQHSMSTCRYNKHRQRHLVESETVRIDLYYHSKWTYYWMTDNIHEFVS